MKARSIWAKYWHFLCKDDRILRICHKTPNTASYKSTDNCNYQYYWRLWRISCQVRQYFVNNNYEADTAAGIKKAFEDAVDDYLTLCEQTNQAPEVPFKGSFNVRVGHKLHEKIALAAQNNNVTINKFICDTLDRACNENTAP